MVSAAILSNVEKELIQEIEEEKKIFSASSQCDSRSPELDLLPSLSLNGSNTRTSSIREKEEDEKTIEGDSSSIVSSTLKRLEQKVSSLFGITRRTAQIILAFLLIGLVGLTNESATGANLNSMQIYYNVSYSQISLVFISNILGYLISCLLTSYLTHHYSFSTSLLLAGILQTIGSLILALAPPFPVFVISLSLLGLGSGLFDACLAVVMSHEESQLLMSLYYSALSLGGCFGPLIVAGLNKQGFQWNIFYYIPFGLTVVLSLIAYPIFSTYEPPPDEEIEEDEVVTSATTSTEVESTSSSSAVRMNVRTRMINSLKLPIVWIGFSLTFLSFGFTDLISAFIVSYQINRGEPTDIAQLELSAIWAGVAIGRIIFSGIIFSKLVKSIPEKIFSILLLGCTAGFLGLLIAVHHAAVNGIALLLIGVFIGPVTPRALSMLGARVPNSIRGSTISMAVSSGLVGAGILPYAFGFAIDKNMNILNSLPAVLIFCSIIMICIWMFVTPIPLALSVKSAVKVEGLASVEPVELVV